MDFTLTFLNVFFFVIGLAAPLLSFLLFVIVVCGQFAGRKEGWTWTNTLYWTFITATTVGYGDMRPTHRRSRVLSVFIAIVGLMLTGIIVAVALNAATYAFDKHVGGQVALKKVEQRVD